MRVLIRFAITFALLFNLGLGGGFSQTITGSIFGTVLDQTGAPAPGARLKLASTAAC